MPKKLPFSLVAEGDDPFPEVYGPDSEKNPALQERVIDVATNSEEMSSTVAAPTKEQNMQAFAAKNSGQELYQSPMDNPNSLMALAIREKSPVEALERLISMRREWKAEQAKEAFDRAMAQFQSECPTIKKTKDVAYGNTRYSYAPLEDIVRQVQSLLSDNGFSYTFDTAQNGSVMTIFCKAKHTLGHSEMSKFEIDVDTTTKMNKSQQYASTLTYGKRYAFCNAFGILTGDSDNDSQLPQERSQTRLNPRQAQSEPTPEDYSDQDAYAPSTGNYEGDAFAEVEYPKKTERLATMAQMNYIKRLRSERGEEEMGMRTLTTSQASNEIERLLQMNPLNKQV